MEIVGKLHRKFDTQQKSEKFASREFILEYSPNPMYPQFIKIELSQDKCALIDQFNVGDRLEVNIDLRGREWNTPDGVTKYFTTVEAWRLQKVAGDASGSNAGAAKADRSIQDLVDETDDLPY